MKETVVNPNKPITGTDTSKKVVFTMGEVMKYGFDVSQQPVRLVRVSQGTPAPNKGRLKGTWVSTQTQFEWLQRMVEYILSGYSGQIHAVYKETTSTDLSYYILLNEDTFDQQQAILSKLYGTTLEQLRKNVKSVYYNFFPKAEEAVLAGLSQAKKLSL